MARRGRYTLSTIIAIAAAFAANGAQWASYIVDVGAVAGVRVMLLRLRVAYADRFSSKLCRAAAYNEPHDLHLSDASHCVR